MQDRYGTRLSSLKLRSRRYNGPIVLLRAVSDSKVKGRQDRATQRSVPSYTATVASLHHTLFTGKQQQLTAKKIKVYCYHLDRDVSFFPFCFFFSLRKEYHDCNGADPELKMPLGADPKWAANLKTTTHRHLIVTECEVVHRANASDPQREGSNTQGQTSTTSAFNNLTH